MSENSGAFAFLQRFLARTRLPGNLRDRLLTDVVGRTQDGHDHYQRLVDIQSLVTKKANSSYTGQCITWFGCCCCRVQDLVPEGQVGLMLIDGVPSFLAAGYHMYPCCGTELLGQAAMNLNDVPVVNGPLGFVTISEGRIGVLQMHGEFKLLAPGTYQWMSSSVLFQSSVDITRSSAKLGPYTLVTVPGGHVAITFHNGALVILGHDEEAADAQPRSLSPCQDAMHQPFPPSTKILAPPMREGAMGEGPAPRQESRIFFLDDPNWTLQSMLDLQIQTDRLEGNDLLSKDNVELLMVAMSQWRIRDPYTAVLQCDESMEAIRVKVNQLVRATIARIVAGTCIGNGPVSGSMAQPMAVRVVAGDAPSQSRDADLAHLMQSQQAQLHMEELKGSMDQIGVEIIGVYVPEKRMKNDDVRVEVAKQAVISIKAEADRSAADAQAYTTETAARAEAFAIEALAKAHMEAGRMLGNPSDTAARLALTEKTAQALQNANVTIFSGNPGNMPFMLNAEPK